MPSIISVDDIVVSESAATATFRLRLSVPDPLNPVTVNWATGSLTASAGSDYTSVAGLATFAPGSTEVTITIPIINNTTVEAAETFRIILSTPSANALLGNTSATATIIDNDAASGIPVLRVSDRFVDEKDGLVQFVITLDKPSTSTVTVNYATAAGTAAAGSDFTTQALQTLSFAAGEVAKTVTILLTDDTTAEGPEFFDLVLSGPVNATLPDTTARAFIGSSDRPTVAAPLISVDDIVVGESDGYAEFLVRLSAPSTQVISVDYSQSNLTATNGSDYVASTGTLRFEAGETLKTVRIALDSDSTLEAKEAFRFNLTNATGGAVLANTAATATIIDNDAASGIPVLRISDRFVDEKSGLVQFVITLDKPSTSTVTVNYATAAGTAAAGSDFTTQALQTLSFAAGEVAKTVTILLTDDTTAEGAEFFDLVLSSPSNATLERTRAHAVIAASDQTTVATPAITAAQVAGGEGDGFLEFVVRLSAPSTQVISVDYSQSNLTATNGSDYVASTGTLRFEAGETLKTVRIALDDNATAEPTETFNFNLSAPVNAVIGTPTVLATIIDNDSPPPAVPVIVNGSAGPDMLHGTAFADTINGAAGDDVLIGGLGADAMAGGTGNDVYFVEDTGDTTSEAGGGGTDTVVSYLNTLTLGGGIENLQLAGGAVTGIGNGLGNRITGTGGNNVLEGGLGNDILDGAGGTDTASYATAAGGVTVTLATPGVQQNTVNAGLDTLISIENLTGSALNDTLTGDAAANVFNGGLGNDVIDGAGGADTASYETAAAGVSVTLATPGVQQNTVNAGLDTLNSIENLTGSGFNDTLTGDAAGNVLNGLAGADNMTGGGGNDTYIVDNIGDLVTELAGGGTDLVQSSVTATLRPNVENLLLTGAAAINGTGNGLGNTLTGNAGANVLAGKGGTDLLTGNSGADFFVFDTALGATNIDEITDFSVVDDGIRLDDAIFTQFVGDATVAAAEFRANTGGNAVDANDFLLYDTTTGNLFYDADGNGAAAKVQFGEIGNLAAVTAADFFIV